MKKHLPNTKPDLLVLMLCDHFRLDHDKITYLEEVEMLYIYNFVKGTIESHTVADVLAEIKRLQTSLKGRSKRKRLYALYFQCKHAAMVASKRYDTDTLKPPTSHNRGQYY